jgi:hypothetical protein
MTSETEKRIWERFDKETSTWFKRFQFFLEMEPSGRGLDACYVQIVQDEGKTPKEVTPTDWKNAYKTFKWEQRAAAFDAHHRAISERDNLLFANEVRHQMQGRVNQLLSRVDQMMSFPLTQTLQDGENGVTIIMPVNHKASDVPSYLRAARELTTFIVTDPALAGSVKGTERAGGRGDRGSFGLAGTIVNDTIKAEVTPEFEEMTNEQLIDYVLSRIDAGVTEVFA